MLKTGAGTVDQTAPAPVLSFQTVLQVVYFSRFFAAAKKL
jgi:hypothetical protein